MTANPQKIINVSALPNVRSVRVVWGNANESIIDLSQFMKEFLIFAPLDNGVRFSQVEVGEWGFEITWDAGGNYLSPHPPCTVLPPSNPTTQSVNSMLGWLGRVLPTMLQARR